MQIGEIRSPFEKILEREDGLNELILKRKPNLKLCPNHYKPKRKLNMIWFSCAVNEHGKKIRIQGTAYADGKGRYISREERFKDVKAHKSA